MNDPADRHEEPPPIACRPGALAPAERARQKELLAVFRTRIMKTVAMENGFALQIPSDAPTFMEAAEWIRLERRCCAFAAFTLELRMDDTVWVTMTGGPGVKEVLALTFSIG